MSWGTGSELSVAGALIALLVPPCVAWYARAVGKGIGLRLDLSMMAGATAFAAVVSLSCALLSQNRIFAVLAGITGVLLTGLAGLLWRTRKDAGEID